MSCACFYNFQLPRPHRGNGELLYGAAMIRSRNTFLQSPDVRSFSYNTTDGGPSAQFRWSWPLEPSTLYVDVSVGTRWVYTHDFDRLARALQLCYDCN